ncbi:MAG: DNA-3-methyladenine glycosylase 2 family protein [Oscillospiraceae bacterium]|nr:DNA-3-methyladenine glycosylase 2 family protein [Oscillospiraceae bacterium]
MLIYLSDDKIDTGHQYIDFKATLCDSGQAFRWRVLPCGTIRGVALGRVVSIRQEGNAAWLENITMEEFLAQWEDYFGIKDDYTILYQAADGDPFFKQCLESGNGLRVLRQNFWEVLVSFIISSCNNIGRISRIIEKLCMGFGERIAGDAYDFPLPERLACHRKEHISAVSGCGYRDEYILEAANLMLAGDFNDLDDLPYSQQIHRLKKCRGIGEKVASCTALFGLHNLSAFPVDIWMSRILSQVYSGGLDIEKFGNLAGVAQQYMFYYALKHKDIFRHNNLSARPTQKLDGG